MTIQEFAHIGINCRDPAATEAFYTKHFGFKRARVVPIGDDQIVFLRTDHGNVHLEIFRATEELPFETAFKDGPGFPGFRHFAFKVDDVDAKLREMGPDARVTLGPLSFDDFIPGWRTAWLADPDGRIVEISQGFTDQDNPPLSGFEKSRENGRED